MNEDEARIGRNYWEKTVELTIGMTGIRWDYCGRAHSGCLKQFV